MTLSGVMVAVPDMFAGVNRIERPDRWKDDLTMRRPIQVVLAIGAAGMLALTACGSSDDYNAAAFAKRPTVGVILPDSVSSPRWETADRPYLKAAFDAAGIDSEIQSAAEDVSKFQTIADSMISEGVKALLIVNLDSDSGAAVIKKATAAGIPVIDYDRLTLGGGAAYYVSFDNVAVGREIGKGLVKCLKDNGQTPADGGVVTLDGAPTDSNAAMFRQGYQQAIRAAGYRIVAAQSVPDWDPIRGGNLFQQIDTRLKGKYIGVAAANDGLGGAVIARLKTEGRAGKVPVTGQDAGDEGLQRLLLGTQCVSIYKSTKQEAAAAAGLTIKLIKGDRAGADALATDRVRDAKTKKDVKSVLLTPQAIFMNNVGDVIKDEATTADRLCTTKALKAACAAQGIS
jgi:D-xylose transport system substrate-binding protein